MSLTSDVRLGATSSNNNCEAINQNDWHELQGITHRLFLTVGQQLWAALLL